MKTLKAIIIDDEPLAQKIIQRFCKDIPFVEVVAQCYFATEAYDLLDREEVDLIFLDIEMPKLKGLDFLKTMTSRPKVIVTTAYEEYALEGFELQVSDYLLKPFSFNRFLRAINKVREELSTFEKDDETAPSNSKRLFIKVDKRHIQVEKSEIQVLESYGNYVKIWVLEEMLLTSRTLTSFELELDSTVFRRVHKSYIVNKNYVHYVEGHRIFLHNDMIIPIGKNHRQSVKEWFA